VFRPDSMRLPIRPHANAAAGGAQPARPERRYAVAAPHPGPLPALTLSLSKERGEKGRGEGGTRAAAREGEGSIAATPTDDTRCNSSRMSPRPSGASRASRGSSRDGRGGPRPDPIRGCFVRPGRGPGGNGVRPLFPFSPFCPFLSYRLRSMFFGGAKKTGPPRAATQP
jgi:hypothetical protein